MMSWNNPRSWPRVPASYLAVAVVLLAGTGLLQGMWTQRWGPSEPLQQAAARLREVPMTVGDWHGTPADLDADALARAGLSGCWMRHYTHAHTGAKVTALLMCGRPGPTAVHTPQWCYGGAGYEMMAAPLHQRMSLDVDLVPVEVWRGQFKKTGTADLTTLRIDWSWSATGQWTAPTHPRMTFASHPALYKLYVLRNIPVGSSADPSPEFMKVFLPQVNDVLFAPAN